VSGKDGRQGKDCGRSGCVPSVGPSLEESSWVKFSEKELGEAWGRPAAEGPGGNAIGPPIVGNEEA